MVALVRWCYSRENVRTRSWEFRSSCDDPPRPAEAKGREGGGDEIRGIWLLATHAALVLYIFVTD